jgi:hypothetical protein
VSDNEAATDQRRANKRSESRVDDQSRVPHSPQRLWAGLAFGALRFKLASSSSQSAQASKQRHIRLFSEMQSENHKTA